MRKGFIKIPMSILDQPWYGDVNATYLYVWLCLNADNDGKIVTSYKQLSKQTGLSVQQLRTALKKLQSTRVATQVPTRVPTRGATQGATQGATIITICHLATYKGEKIATNTGSNTGINMGINMGSNTGTNTDTKEEKEKNQKKKNKIYNPPALTYVSASPQRGDPHAGFIAWLRVKCPYIYKNLELPTEQELAKLKESYTAKEIADECEKIENRVDLRKKYKNLYRTLLNWLKREKQHGNNNASNQERARAVGEAALTDLLAKL